MFELQKYYLWQSGGNCMVDVFNGKDDCIAVTEEVVCYYTKTNCGYGDDMNDDDFCEGFVVLDLCEVDSDLRSKSNGSVIAWHDDNSFTLNTGKKFQFEDIKQAGIELAKSKGLIMLVSEQ